MPPSNKPRRVTPRLFWIPIKIPSAYPVVSANHHRLWSALGERSREIRRATYLLIGRGFLPGSEAEERLERGHGLLPPVVAKDEFVEIDLELIAAHTVISSDQPLLQVADRAVCQRHHGLCAFTQVDSQRLAARHVLEPSFWQPSEAFETVGVYR